MDVIQTLLIVGLVVGFGVVVFVIAKSRAKERAERASGVGGSGGSARPVQKK